jgi:aldehyde:ferredoxin oxidoreductase
MSTPAGRQTFTYESFRDLGELLGVHSSNLAAAYARACDRNGLDPARHGGLNWTYGAADILTEVRA